MGSCCNSTQISPPIASLFLLPGNNMSNKSFQTRSLKTPRVMDVRSIRVMDVPTWMLGSFQRLERVNEAFWPWTFARNSPRCPQGCPAQDFLFLVFAQCSINRSISQSTNQSIYITLGCLCGTLSHYTPIKTPLGCGASVCRKCDGNLCHVDLLTWGCASSGVWSSLK